MFKIKYFVLSIILISGVIVAGVQAVTYNESAIYEANLLNNPAGDQIFTTVRNGAGTGVVAPTETRHILGITSTSTSDTYDHEFRGGVVFNTTLPVGAVITSGFLIFYHYSDTTFLGPFYPSIVNFTPLADGGTFVAGDFAATKFVRMTGDYTSPLGPANATNKFILNADGISAINTTGNTSFLVVLNRTTDLAEPIWASATSSTYQFRPIEYASGLYAPRLVLNYYLPDQEQPAIPKNIIITFDDGFVTGITDAYPILSAYNYNATFYVNPGSVPASTPTSLMSLPNLTTLYLAGGDISNHGYNHTDLTTVSAALQESIIDDGQIALDNWGFTRSSHHLAYPYGGHNAGVISSATNKSTLTARTVETSHIITPQSDLLNLPLTILIDNATTVQDVQNTIDNSATNESVIVAFHAISNTAGTYNWSPANFQSFVNYIHGYNFSVITISQWYDQNGVFGTQDSQVNPIADFSANITYAHFPATIQFTDLSESNILGRNWTFGDGENSTDTNPVHTYTTSGTYTVSLEVVNLSGYNTTTKADYITVTSLDPPLASFTKDASIGVQPATIQFTDTSTNTPTQWNWSFGDGTWDNETQSPAKTYSTGGNYSVYLIASNAAGTDTTDIQYVRIYNQTTAVLSQNPDVHDVYVPPGSLSVDYYGHTSKNVTRWSWWLDNQWYNGTDHAYYNITMDFDSLTHNYTIGLYTSDDGYGESHVNTTYNITEGVHAQFSGTPLTGNAPASVQFTDSSSGDADTWFWVFGDGDTTNNTQQNPLHTYLTDGLFNVSLNASHSGSYEWENKTGYVNLTSDVTPTAAFTKSRPLVRIPQLMWINDSSLNMTTGNWNVSWGDGSWSNTSVASEKNATHTYRRPALFTISLAVTNTAGTNTTTDRIWVTSTSYQLTPGGNQEEMVNCEAGTYSTSRELSAIERLATDWKIADLCS